MRGEESALAITATMLGMIAVFVLLGAVVQLCG